MKQIKLQDSYETTVFTFTYSNAACLLCKLYTINAVPMHYMRLELKPSWVELL
jgi:hypothetical protein